ncbi:MAG: N-acetyl-gamma-glutamyl-phosphate reductase [Bacteroidales bacterium]|nr:N-acetyl-gamma-glutamyl-phosphate reductase [Candidatus Cacconaster scatequi]
MIKAGIIGGAGYTAGELVRILLNHPDVELAYVQSSSNAGNRLCDVHGGIYGETDMTFCGDFPLEDVDVLFLCSGHGKSTEFWSSRKCPSSLKVIDLAQDFRDESCGYVYGLPEINRERLRAAQLVANPGCFATAIQLAILPLAAAGLLKGDVAVTAVTGSTGAGVKPGATTHFSWRNNNLSTYKAFEHQHLKEINMNVLRMQPAFSGSIDFVPMRGDFARGIFASVQTGFDGSLQDAQELYREFYKDAAFTFLYDGNLDLKQVVNTNKGLVSVEKHGDRLLVNSVIDNLLKGASGQAVQNMNLIFGLDEKAGLNLKASAF